MKLQVTLFDKNKKFRPLSTLIDIPNMEYVTEHRKEIINKAYQQIASKKYVVSSQLYDDGYTLVKMREYDQEKIKRENLLNYIYNKRQKEKEKA